MITDEQLQEMIDERSRCENCPLGEYEAAIGEALKELRDLREECWKCDSPHTCDALHGVPR